MHIMSLKIKYSKKKPLSHVMKKQSYFPPKDTSHQSLKLCVCSTVSENGSFVERLRFDEKRKAGLHTISQSTLKRKEKYLYMKCD